MPLVTHPTFLTRAPRHPPHSCLRFASLTRGVKECEGNERIKGYTEKGVVCWTGNDDEAHDARYEAGAVGVISVTSNIVPGLMHKLMHDGPNPELRDQLLPLMNW